MQNSTLGQSSDQLQCLQVFLYTGRLHFRVMHRRDIEAQVLTGRRTGRDKRSPVPGSPSSDPSHAPGFGDEAFLRELSSGESHGAFSLCLWGKENMHG